MMTKRLPAASEIVAKVLQEMGENISVDEVEAAYERTKGYLSPTTNRHERRKAKRETREQIENEATEYLGNVVGRLGWIMFGKYPNPPEWERPMIAQMMQAAGRGDDSALVWLKKRFPPSDAEEQNAKPTV